MTPELAACPVRIEIPVAWGEMDAFQHVNNVVYLRYFESARIAYFERAAYRTLMAQTGAGPILGSTHCRYRFPLTYPDRVWVGARVVEVGHDRFRMAHWVESQTHGRIAAEGEGLIVSYDYAAGRKCPLPPAWHAAIATIEGNS